jgi:hypothetical protein
MQSQEFIRVCVAIDVKLSDLEMCQQPALSMYVDAYLLRSREDTLELAKESLRAEFLVEVLYLVRYLFGLQLLHPLYENFCTEEDERSQ